MKTRTEKVIDVHDWDEFVSKTYGRIYCFQQQDGCRSRGVFRFSVPDKEVCDFARDTVPEEVNHPTMGVSFKAWLARPTSKQIKDQEYDWQLDMWWERNFYPQLQMVANDLHSKGLLKAGNYTIDIDW